jgi:outer membrane protein assembly factor BamB
VDGLVIAQVGGRTGAVIAYDLKSGEEKWKRPGGSTGYASPILLTIDKEKVLVFETEQTIEAISVKDNKSMWKASFPSKGRMNDYNSSTPLADGQTLIYAGSLRGTRAVKLAKKGDELTASELWSNKDHSVVFNSPVLKDGLLYSISGNDVLFCINTKDGKTAWTSKLKSPGGRNRGYGSIVDAGAVLFALNPSANLVVFEPSDKELKQVASYKVASTETFAYPIISGNRVFIKDKNSVTLWTIE